MGTPALAAVLVVVGIATALIGLVTSILMSRRRQVSSPRIHTDAGLVVLVTGLIVSIFGAGDWTFLILVS